MSQNRYAPLPNPRTDHDADRELDAAFDSDDGDDDLQDISESQPLTRSASPHSSQSRSPGAYDFENLDYDYPPPGSPPPNSAFGNSNGLVPSFNDISRPVPRGNWFTRSMQAVLPTRYAQRFSHLPQRPQGPVGGGTGNDGVFANVTAKPAPQVTVQDGDDTHVVPEDARAEAPPSYQSAQADAVPPYWETTVHAPFNPDSAGEMIIDNLPTGSLFSFLWNMLVSISFQFVGFLLTYLLHTTHSARLGSRAGLGVTLIQYGFALRNRADYQEGNGSNPWGDWRGDSTTPRPTGPPSNAMMASHMGPGNSTLPKLSDEQASMLVADATTEWLSFFLMTVGWFILLTSLLGFWRVKRWERGILASQRENAQPSQPRDQPVSQFERVFGLRTISRGDLFRQGFGFGTRDEAAEAEADRALIRTEEGELHESDLIIEIDPNDPNRARIVRDALTNERRLHGDLRAAGLL